MTKTNFWEVCKGLYGDQESYYHRWYHEKPMVITPERNEELREMHGLVEDSTRPIYTTEPYEPWGTEESSKHDPTTTVHEPVTEFWGNIDGGIAATKGDVIIGNDTQQITDAIFGSQ